MESLTPPSPCPMKSMIKNANTTTTTAATTTAADAPAQVLTSPIEMPIIMIEKMTDPHPTVRNPSTLAAWGKGVSPTRKGNHVVPGIAVVAEKGPLHTKGWMRKCPEGGADVHAAGRGGQHRLQKKTGG